MPLKYSTLTLDKVRLILCILHVGDKEEWVYILNMRILNKSNAANCIKTTYFPKKKKKLALQSDKTKFPVLLLYFGCSTSGVYSLFINNL